VVGAGAQVALGGDQGVEAADRGRIELPAPLLWLLAIGIVMSLGTLWEVFEFAIDRTGLFQAQRGLTDTMLDLIADMLGALAATSAMVGLPRRKFGLAP